MNKLILFPLIVLFMITLFNFSYFGTQDYNSTTPEINGSTNYWFGIPIGENTVPEGSFNIWETGFYMLTIFLVAVVISVLSGINILGSGLTDFAQSVIANSSLWLGIWFALSYGASYLLFSSDSILTTIFWLILTGCYVIGLSFNITSSEG